MTDELKYGDITDLKFANEIIESQRKTIKEQHETIRKQEDLIENLRIELNLSSKDYKIFREIFEEATDLVKSHLSPYYQRKWKVFCEKRGVFVDD